MYTEQRWHPSILLCCLPNAGEFSRQGALAHKWCVGCTSLACVRLVSPYWSHRWKTSLPTPVLLCVGYPLGSRIFEVRANEVHEAPSRSALVVLLLGRGSCEPRAGQCLHHQVCPARLCAVAKQGCYTSALVNTVENSMQRMRCLAPSRCWSSSSSGVSPLEREVRMLNV